VGSCLTGNFLWAMSFKVLMWGCVGARLRIYLPTLDEASVRLFKVVLLPDDGFPTSPIKGSRPMLTSCGV
jgi:hypothetical protein